MNLLKYFTPDNKYLQICLYSMAILVLAVEPSYAQNFAGVNNFLDAIVQAITGPIGVSVAALAVIAVGFLFMTGRMDWQFAIAVIIGIAIVFGAASFVGGIAAT